MIAAERAAASDTQKGRMTAMATWNTRGLRGSSLRELLNRTNEIYLEKGLALIQKIPDADHSS